MCCVIVYSDELLGGFSYTVISYHDRGGEEATQNFKGWKLCYKTCVPQVIKTERQQRMIMLATEENTKSEKEIENKYLKKNNRDGQNDEMFHVRMKQINKGRIYNLGMNETGFRPVSRTAQNCLWNKNCIAL